MKSYAIEFSNDLAEYKSLILRSLKPDEVLIENKAAGINRADLMQRDGNYPPPKGASSVLGLEVAGIVLAKGSKVQTLKEGDAVCALLEGGGYARHSIARESTCFAKPKSMNFLDAAGIPEAFITAFQVLEIESTNKDRNGILIHAAASGVGMAAIQLAALEYKWIVCTASKSKHAFCRSLGADFMLDYRAADFFDKLGQVNAKIDLIIDPVGGPYFKKNLELLNRDGCLISLATMGGHSSEINLLTILLKRLSLIGTTLRSRSKEYKRELIAKFANDILPLFDAGKLSVYVDKVFPIEEVDNAHAFMRNNRNKGKIILTIN